MHAPQSHQPQYVNYSASYPPPPPRHHPALDQPPPYEDYAPPHPSTSYAGPPPPRPAPQSKAAPAPAAKVKKPSAATTKKAAAATKTGPAPVQLEYRLVNGVRMVVGKEGRLFDPNPAPGCGTVDFECCFCDKSKYCHSLRWHGEAVGAAEQGRLGTC